MAEPKQKSSLTLAQIDEALKRILDGSVASVNGINSNLLDNWFFGNPVNQKGRTEYSGARQYCVDRWTLVSALSAKIEDGSVKFTNAGTGNNGISQHLNANLAQGTVVTASCLAADGNFYYGTATVPAIDKYNTAFTTAEGSTGRVYAATSDGGMPRFILMMRSGATEQIVAFKLELGSQQTLAHQDENGNWVLNEIPDYGEQLLKCQRHYQLFSSADARPSDLADYRPNMRANPAIGTIDIGGKTYYFADANL